MKREQRGLFFGGLLIGVVVFAAVAVRVLPTSENIPPTAKPSSETDVGAATVLVMLAGKEGLSAAATVSLDGAAGRIEVRDVPPETAVVCQMDQVRLSTLYRPPHEGGEQVKAALVRQNVPVTRWVVLTVDGMVRWLSPFGNDLPFRTEEAINVSAADGYLHLPVGESVLSASQVGVLLRHRPSAFAAVVAAVLERYATDDLSPTAFVGALLSAATESDLSPADPLVYERLLRCVWGDRRTAPVTVGRLSGSFVGAADDRWFYLKENS